MVIFVHCSPIVDHSNRVEFFSTVNLCSNFEDKLQIYRENFEKAYLESTENFYKVMCAQYLSSNGVQNYMRYADQKLREEEVRAKKYLESDESVRLVGPSKYLVILQAKNICCS
jgi:hypothetical protein